MPTSVATATVLALAVIPGAVGAYVWAVVNGQDWREKDWEAAVRFVAFSALGLGVYVFLALWLGLPPAIHVIPSTYESASLRAASLVGIFVPYLGHIACSALVGGAAAAGHRVICVATGSSPQPSTWDNFLKSAVPKHWVVVTLKSGDVYAGYVQTAEESAPTSERDLIIRAPAKYDDTTKNYCVTSLQDLFIPADLVHSIGTVRSDSELSNEPSVNTYLFPLSVQDD
jgi:hypothetical protein